MTVIIKDRQPEIDALNNNIVELALLLAKANGKIVNLTEQLRLANADAERLASVVKAYSGITVTERAYPNDETTYQFAYDALRLHEERIVLEEE